MCAHMMFRINEGNIDRIIRFVLSVIIIVFAFTSLTGWLQVLGYVIGVVLIVTAITGFCALYAFLGMTTKK
jgi:hypothetical protein